MTRLWQKQNSIQIEDIIKNTIKLLINTLIEREEHKKYIYTIEQQRLTMMMMRTFAHFMKFNGAPLTKPARQLYFKSFLQLFVVFFFSMCNIQFCFVCVFCEAFVLLLLCEWKWELALVLCYWFWYWPRFTEPET